MKFQSKAALSLLVCAVFALPTAATAGNSDRDPSSKDCPNVTLDTRCSAELDAAYALIESLQNNAYVFTSRNGTQDAGTLMCKISGAEIKLSQDKDAEASYLLYKAMEKIWSLEGQGKFEDVSQENGIKAAIAAAQDCVDNP